mmetsp:Transcript_36404/g.71973  ORF Transcript_36404/g.71973 Transcript_36404/m.71973 type:complete len:83 (+) Transcript_36404:1307-1555(+)
MIRVSPSPCDTPASDALVASTAANPSSSFGVVAVTACLLAAVDSPASASGLWEPVEERLNAVGRRMKLLLLLLLLQLQFLLQ